MFDLNSLGANLFWIAGLFIAAGAVLTAAFDAVRRRESLRSRLRRRGYQAVLMGAAAIFCVGLALTARSTWEMVLWAALGFLFLTQVAAALWAPERIDEDRHNDRRKR
jgi:hypothetical protein